MEEKKSSMKKILVGFDGSQGSEKALYKALNLIDEGGEIIILAVIPSRKEKSFVDKGAYEAVKKHAHELINEKISLLKSSRFKLTGIVVVGDATERIIEWADKKECDLIILGRRGESEINPKSIGSVAEKVVKNSYKPVMIVR